MPRNKKPDLYSLLRQAGAPLTTTYAKYKTEDLIRELTALNVDLSEVLADEPAPAPPPRQTVRAPAPEEAPAYEQMPAWEEPESEPVRVSTPVQTRPAPRQQAQADPNEMPGQRLNTKPEDEPIRIDEQGRLWYQEEVRKPAYPKPRGRRVLKYMDTGVKTETVQNGEYVETFEVAGIGEARPAEVKITLPSYQVGIYKDPRFPFKIHCYGDREGFDFFEINDYYGGAELVPDAVKRVYIENELCYDIRSVIRAIENEYRQLQLMGKV